MAMNLARTSRDWSSFLAEWGVFYVLGPMDESSITEVRMQSQYEEDFSLLVPSSLPASLLDALAFQDGAAIGYACREEMGETPVQVANLVYRDFRTELFAGGTYSWIIGFLLGCLSVLAEQDRQLALVGIAHVCFLVSLVPDCSCAGFHRAMVQADTLHNAVVRAHRARVQILRRQGRAIEEAWRLALGE